MSLTKKEKENKQLTHTLIILNIFCVQQTFTKITYLNLKLSMQDTSNQCMWDELKNTLKSESMVLNWCASSGSWWRMSSEPMKMLSRWAQVLCTSSHSNSTESARVSWACSSNTCPWKNAACLLCSNTCSCTWVRNLQRCIYRVSSHQVGQFLVYSFIYYLWT